MPKPSSIRPAVTIQYRFVTDGRTDRRRDGHTTTANTQRCAARTASDAMRKIASLSRDDTGRALPGYLLPRTFAFPERLPLQKPPSLTSAHWSELVGVRVRGPILYYIPAMPHL